MAQKNALQFRKENTHTHTHTPRMSPLFLWCKESKKLDRMYSTGTYIQSPGINHHGKEYKKELFMCITESLCCTVDTNTTL